MCVCAHVCVCVGVHVCVCVCVCVHVGTYLFSFLVSIKNIVFHLPGKYTRVHNNLLYTLGIEQTEVNLGLGKRQANTSVTGLQRHGSLTGPPQDHVITNSHFKILLIRNSF